jgi:hypothetical protein
MKVEATMFVRLRRLAPVLDDVLNTGELERVDQAANLALLAQLCSQLFDVYHRQRWGDVTQAPGRLHVGTPRIDRSLGRYRSRRSLPRHDVLSLIEGRLNWNHAISFFRMACVAR